jgi:hypothetical protein
MHCESSERPANSITKSAEQPVYNKYGLGAIVNRKDGTDIRRIGGERVESGLSGVDGGKTRLQGDCVEGSETQSPSR